MEINKYQIVAWGWEGNSYSNILVHSHKFTKDEFQDYIRPIATRLMNEKKMKYFNEVINDLEKELIELHQFAVIEDDKTYAGFDEFARLPLPPTP